MLISHISNCSCKFGIWTYTCWQTSPSHVHTRSVRRFQDQRVRSVWRSGRGQHSRTEYIRVVSSTPPRGSWTRRDGDRWCWQWHELWLRLVHLSS